MSNNVEIIKKRIRKLLALSKSPNEHEALAALKKAQDLMEEYRLTPAECVYTLNAVKATKRISEWRTVLSNTVAHLYACETFRDASSGEILFYGETFDSFMAKEMYSYLSKTIDRMVKQNVRKSNTLKYKNKYRYGIACRLAIRIHELGQNVSWAPERNSKLSAVKKSLENEKGLVITTTGQVKMDKGNRAFKRGMSDGMSISLHRQATARSGYLEERTR